MHFDFKGAPPKPSYFISLLPLLQNMGFNGLLIEWEDMFPYKGRLANAINGDAYTMDEVRGRDRPIRNLNFFQLEPDKKKLSITRFEKFSKSAAAFSQPNTSSSLICVSR
ncbi:unnamed protein product [Meloidogyne enterolobii]|uniref:Uncharacterized protein n=1 Tax=Meloidogyne enterolobii TaxID=390850 RepID=A0ACB1AQN8_MELEN